MVPSAECHPTKDCQSGPTCLSDAEAGRTFQRFRRVVSDGGWCARSLLQPERANSQADIAAGLAVGRTVGVLKPLKTSETVRILVEERVQCGQQKSHVAFIQLAQNIRQRAFTKTLCGSLRRRGRMINRLFVRLQCGRLVTTSTMLCRFGFSSDIGFAGITTDRISASTGLLLRQTDIWAKKESQSQQDRDCGTHAFYVSDNEEILHTTL